MLTVDLLRGGARKLRLLERLVGLQHAFHLLPGGSHELRALLLHDLRTHARGAAVARVEIEIVHPARGGAVDAVTAACQRP